MLPQLGHHQLGAPDQGEGALGGGQRLGVDHLDERAGDLELRADTAGVVAGAGLLHVGEERDALVGHRALAGDLGDQRAQRVLLAVVGAAADGHAAQAHRAGGQTLLEVARVHGRDVEGQRPTRRAAHAGVLHGVRVELLAVDHRVVVVVDLRRERAGGLLLHGEAVERGSRGAGAGLGVVGRVEVLAGEGAGLGRPDVLALDELDHADVDEIALAGLRLGVGERRTRRAGERRAGRQVAALVDQRLGLGADVVEEPLVRDPRRVVRGRRVEGVDGEVEVVRLARHRVAGRADDLERGVLRRPDLVARPHVVLEPVVRPLLVLAFDEAEGLELGGQPVEALVEPGPAVGAPAEVRDRRCTRARSRR